MMRKTWRLKNVHNPLEYGFQFVYVKNIFLQKNITSFLNFVESVHVVEMFRFAEFHAEQF